MTAQTLHVRLPEETHQALVRRQDELRKQGIHVSLSTLARGIIEQGLGSNGKRERSRGNGKATRT
jgi:hypothetical protein